MCHYAQLTVSEMPAAVTVETLNPPAVDVDCVTPPLKVAVNVSAYFRITIPEPPAPPANSTPLLSE
jgi:hypothetical protein